MSKNEMGNCKLKGGHFVSACNRFPKYALLQDYIQLLKITTPKDTEREREMGGGEINKTK